MSSIVEYRLTRNALHLVHATPQLVSLLPSTGHTTRALVHAGFFAGDTLWMLEDVLLLLMLPRYRAK